MKSRTIFLSLLALSAALFAGCRQEEADIDLPGIQVSGADLTFDADTKKAACAVDMDLTTLTLSVMANRDWTASIKWDTDEVPWIAVTPDSGTASDTPQRVVVTILNNAGFNRSKQVKFSINYDYKTLDLSQAGERGEEIIGTVDNPLTVAGAVKYVKGLGADVQSPSRVFVKGKVSSIDDGGNFAASGTFGNATFYISDDGTGNGDQFYCYRILYLGNKKWSSKTDTDIQVGDDVLICGQVVNYKGNTPETVQGTAFVYEHNGVNKGIDGEEGSGGSTVDPAGAGTLADPYNVAKALAVAKPLTWTSDKVYDATDVVYVAGKISRIADNGTFAASGTFGNATFYISDDGTGSAELYCYRILYLGNKPYTAGDDIKVGDDVVVCGKLMNYRGNTPETVANAAYLYSLNGNTDSGGSGEGGGEGGETPSGEVKAVTVAGFLAAAESDKQVYELVGTIGGTINTTYGNFDLTDESGTVYVYGLTATDNGYGTKNDKSFASLNLHEGDKIKVRGYRGSFTDSNTGVKKDELVYAWFIEKVTGGDGTVSNPYSALEAIAAVKDLTWTSNTVYDKTDKVYVKGKISRIANNGTYTQGGTFGNASYWISADGTENEEFQIFRSLYFNGEKFTEGHTDIQVGDEVIVYGALMNYKGNTPETVANESWLYSLNGKTSDEGSGGSGAATPVSFDTNSEAQSWAAATDGTYGAGFSATVQNVAVGYYKHQSSSAMVAPNSNEVRLYKKSVLVLTAPAGKTFKKITVLCQNTENGKYCLDMSGLEGGANATADKSALTVTWSGSAAKVVLMADGGQVRMKGLELEFE